jgi:hypothetical protein
VFSCIPLLQSIINQKNTASTLTTTDPHIFKYLRCSSKGAPITVSTASTSGCQWTGDPSRCYNSECHCFSACSKFINRFYSANNVVLYCYRRKRIALTADRRGTKVRTMNQILLRSLILESVSLNFFHQLQPNEIVTFNRQNFKVVQACVLG